MIFPEELQSLDFGIINFINKKGIVSEAEILNHFSTDIDATKLRIDLLSRPDRRADIPIPIPNTNYIRKIYTEKTDSYGGTIQSETGDIELTPLGKKTLQDYKLKNSAESKKYLIRSILIPIGVSIITTIVTLLITKYLGLYLL